MPRQLWLPSAAKRWGLDVVEVDGWRGRGSESFDPKGLVNHHTGGPRAGGDMPSLPTLITGRPDLPGPLANYGLGRSGLVYVVASGRANHAGRGGWRGLQGNSSVVGIEAENDGKQPWPKVQLDAYWRLSAAISDTLDISPDMVCRHHEWRAEKPDPHDIDGNQMRAEVSRRLIQGPGGEDMAAANAPAVEIGTDGRRHTVIRGGDGALWHLIGTDPKAWVRVGGSITSAPALAATLDGGLVAGAIGKDGQVFHIAYNGTSWGAWQGVGGGV
jgi:hypothetical protein